MGRGGGGGSQRKKDGGGEVWGRTRRAKMAKPIVNHPGCSALVTPCGCARLQAASIINLALCTPRIQLVLDYMYVLL